MKGAMGFSTSSDSEAPLKSSILVFGAFLVQVFGQGREEGFRFAGFGESADGYRVAVRDELDSFFDRHDPAEQFRTLDAVLDRTHDCLNSIKTPFRLQLPMS